MCIADGADTVIDGGDGYDRLYVQGDQGLTVNLTAGDDMFDGTDAADQLRLYGRDEDDQLTGGLNNDYLRGDA